MYDVMYFFPCFYLVLPGVYLTPHYSMLLVICLDCLLVTFYIVTVMWNIFNQMFYHHAIRPYTSLFLK